MEDKLSKLLEKVDFFYKNAGLVKIPPTLLKEVEDWAICNYARKVTEAYDERIKLNKLRINNHQNAEKTLEHFSKGIDLIRKVVFEENVPLNFLQFKKWAQQYQFNKIPYFNDNEKDIRTGLTGILDSVYKSPILNLSLVELGKNDFHFWLNVPKISHPLMDDGTISSVNIEEKNITRQRLKQILKENLYTISSVYNSFKSAVRYYDMYTPDAMKELHDEKAIFYKLFNNNQKTCNRDQEFVFPANILPYVKDIDPELTKLIFNAKFETSRFMITDHVSGTWSVATMFFPAFLGTIHIYRDIQEDFENMGPEALKNALEDIKSTVSHELTHLIQSTIAKLNKLKEWAGLPSKKLRDKRYDFHGAIPETKDRIDHELRDVEFYPRLSDTVKNYLRIIKYFPLALHKTVAKVWIGEISSSVLEKELKIYDDGKTNTPYETAQDMIYQVNLFRDHRLFDNLRTKQPLKYQKAVKEFYKAVGL